LLVACGFVLLSTLLIRASGGAPAPRAGGSEPWDAVARGLLAFFDRRLPGLDGNGRACVDCHMASDHFQLSPANVEARFQRLHALRRRHPDADDPLFRPIDADDFRINGENASDFSNLRENGLVRITFTLPANMRLIDPDTNEPSAETFVDVRRSVPTVNDVALTGPDEVNPWPRGPNESGGYQLDARITTLQEQARAARSPTTPRCSRHRRRNCSTIWRRFSGCSSRIIASVPSPRPSDRAGARCPIPIHG
jgi:hypothetical protein